MATCNGVYGQLSVLGKMSFAYYCFIVASEKDVRLAILVFSMGRVLYPAPETYIHFCI